MKTKVQYVNPIPVTEDPEQAVIFSGESAAKVACDVLNQITTPIFNGVLAEKDAGMNWCPKEYTFKIPYRKDGGTLTKTVWLIVSQDQNGGAGTALVPVYFRMQEYGKPV